MDWIVVGVVGAVFGVLFALAAKAHNKSAARAAMGLSDEELAKKVDAAYLQDSINCVYFDEAARRSALRRRLVMK